MFNSTEITFSTPTAQDVIFRFIKLDGILRLGGILKLLPDNSSSTEPITGILWKRGTDKVAEWDQGSGPDVVYNETFRNRTELNVETGALVIKNMTKEDSGTYSVEINGRLQNKTYEVSVITVTRKYALCLITK